jgi:hypothetical protein
MSFDKVNGHTVVHSYHEMLLGDEKKKMTDTCNNLDEPSQNYTEWNKCQSQKNTRCIIAFT